jgi:signal transduction histidine kinase
LPILIGAAELQKSPPLWICCVLDLTAQKQAEQDRLAFVDAATHDLKNPLAALKAQTQLLLRRMRKDGQYDEKMVQTGLVGIDSSITRMTTLIDEIGDAARLRAGQDLQLLVGSVDLVEMAARCVTNYQVTSQNHDLRLDTSLRSLVGIWDETRLERVVSNLLTNAIKYSPSGGLIEVQITSDKDPTGVGWAILAVRDPGIGIPASDLPHVFDRFRRGSNVGRLVGSGIGLAASLQIVEQHGGTITVVSDEGKGSTFTVRLPLESLREPAPSGS